MRIRIEARYLRVLMPHIEDIFRSENKYIGMRYYKNFLIAGNGVQFGVMKTSFEKSEDQIFIPYETCKRISEYAGNSDSFFIEKDEDEYVVRYRNVIEYIDQESPIDLKAFAEKVDFNNDQGLFVHLGSFERIKKVADQLFLNKFVRYTGLREQVFCCGEAFVCKFFEVKAYTGFISPMQYSKVEISDSFCDAKKVVQELLA